MRTLLTACLVAAPLIAATVNAQTTTVWNPAANPTTTGLWSESANWTGGVVPDYSYKVVFNVAGASPCTVKSVATPGQLVMGDGGPGTVIIGTGGTLTTGTNWTGLGYNNVAGIEVRSGGAAIFNDHLWVGFLPGADGTLTLNGGTVNVSGMFGLGWNGGKGSAFIYNGTLNLAQWHPTDSIKSNSIMDITAGKVVITGNVLESVSNYVAVGKIISYAGAGTVASAFDEAAGKTTLTGIRPIGVGPFAPTNWPTSIKPDKKVHFFAADESFGAPNENWNNSLGLLNDGDQTTIDGMIKGFVSKKAASSFFNITDSAYQEWNAYDRIDILMQVYGDISVLKPGNLTLPRHIQFLTGTVPTELAVDGGDYSIAAYNQRWNWIAFSITNTLIDGGPNHKVGFVPDGAQGNTTYGGVNGGTIRLQGPDNGVNGMSVHAIAFGEPGAFGAIADINQFDVPDVSCGPVPDENLVGIDIAASVTNHLVVLNDQDQTVTAVTDVGPTGDKRNAVLPQGTLLNFGITDEFLGKPCHDNATFKVCLDFYDDPAFAGMGVQFGPEAYAIDASGAVAVFPAGQLQTLEGSGKWIRRSWLIPGVNLKGVNTGSLTGGPRFICVNGQVAVSRCEMAILRTGDHPLAGQDPLADCYSDPLVCSDVYGNFAELDLARGITDGLDVGTSGGDQFMVTEEAGPVGDRRMAVRPSYGDIGTGQFLNFAILTNAFGPSTQPNARLAMAVTYYDDPALVGKGFRPQVWKMDSSGTEVFNYLQPKDNIVLQGTDKWRVAYWELPAIKFTGVNQGPQAAARFDLEGKIFVTRVRYAVIRACGPNMGRNLLESEKPSMTIARDIDGQLKMTWLYKAPQNQIQGINTFGELWAPLQATNTIENSEWNAVLIAPEKTTRFFRLVMP